jgi:zinc/manganese transport system permease protein
VVFALTATVGGILLALGGRIPISPYVTTLSFLIYVVCRVAGGIRAKRGSNGRVLRTAAVPAA